MKELTIYTDGAYSPIRNQGGVGIVFIKEDKKILEYSRTFKNTTNNKMEICAVLIALQTVLTNKIEGPITIITDSQYVIGCAEKGWNRRMNKRSWKEYDRIKSELDKKGIKVIFEWVKGHAKNKFNNLADHLATDASQI